MGNKPDILLIYQGVPDYIQVYMIPGDHMDADTILACHGRYINGGHEDDDPCEEKLQALNTLLYNSEEKNELAQYAIYNDNDTSQLAEMKDLTTLAVAGKLQVVVTGFYL